MSNNVQQPSSLSDWKKANFQAMRYPFYMFTLETYTPINIEKLKYIQSVTFTAIDDYFKHMEQRCPVILKNFYKYLTPQIMLTNDFLSKSLTCTEIITLLHDHQDKKLHEFDMDELHKQYPEKIECQCIKTRKINFEHHRRTSSQELQAYLTEHHIPLKFPKCPTHISEKPIMSQETMEMLKGVVGRYPNPFVPLIQKIDEIYNMDDGRKFYTIFTIDKIFDKMTLSLKYDKMKDMKSDFSKYQMFEEKIFTTYAELFTHDDTQQQSFKGFCSYILDRMSKIAMPKEEFIEYFIAGSKALTIHVMKTEDMKYILNVLRFDMELE